MDIKADLDTQNITDETLIAQTQAGENEAFGILFERYRDRIAGMLNRYGFQKADVEDITQQVFLKAFCALHSFRGDSRFYTWLYRIAGNAALSFKDVSARRREINWKDCDEFYSPTAETERKCLSVEQESVAAKHIESLPRGMKDAFFLHTFKGFDYCSVALIIDCPVGTVRSRISRARSSVRSAVTNLAA